MEKRFKRPVTKAERWGGKFERFTEKLSYIALLIVILLVCNMFLKVLFS
jgi:hypothetical protein